MRLVFVTILIAVCIPATYCRTECVQVFGRFVCPGHPHLVHNLTVQLRDGDSLPLEVDDQMGRTWTSINGSFVLAGCGSDLGPFNTPDPYIEVKHQCPSILSHLKDKSFRTMQFGLMKIFLPKIQNIGKIFLDDSDA